MAIVAELIGTKGGGLVCVGGGATVLDATKLMNNHHVGSVLAKLGVGNRREAAAYARDGQSLAGHG